MMRDILRWAGVVYPETLMDNFIDSHNVRSNETGYSTFQRSRERIAYWRNEISQEYLELVNEACGDVLKYFNYRL